MGKVKDEEDWHRLWTATKLINKQGCLFLWSHTNEFSIEGGK